MVANDPVPSRVVGVSLSHIASSLSMSCLELGDIQYVCFYTGSLSVTRVDKIY